MLILGIDTATDQVSCAVGGHEGVLACSSALRPRRHAELLAPAIKTTCEQADVSLNDLGAVAVDHGPGLFTGLRVGLATAKTLAQALRLPVISISSLDLLAFSVRFSPRLIAAVLDARRGEIFHALYRQVPGGIQRVTDRAVGPPGDLCSEILAQGEESLLVGDGALRHKEEFETLHQVEIAEGALGYPSAADLVTLAHAQALREEWSQPAEVLPLYLRQPDAEASWSTRAGPYGEAVH